MKTTAEVVELMKTEIVRDVREGTVPANVRDFSQLHDFVDANCYGDMEAAFDEVTAGSHGDDDKHQAALDRLSEVYDPAQKAINEWIKAGGLREELAKCAC